MLNNLIVEPIRISNNALFNDNLTIKIDTGAASTFISAKALFDMEMLKYNKDKIITGLNRLPYSEFKGVDRTTTIKAHRLRLREVQIQNYCINNMTVYVKMDFENDIALLGMDVLSACDFEYVNSRFNITYFSASEYKDIITELTKTDSDRGMQLNYIEDLI